MLQLKSVLPIALLILLMGLLQWIGVEKFRFETALISEHEWWRIWTGHWIHANWTHLGLNATGLVLCLYLSSVNWTYWQWVWRILYLSSGISISFLLLHPDLGWYVGFSGVLFGLFVLTAIASLPSQAGMSYLLLAFIAIKILLEQFSTFNVGSGDIIGVPVLVDAHLYGVVSALMLFMIQSIYLRISDRAEGL